MISARRAVQRSLFSAGHEERLKDRQQEIDSVENPIKRDMLRALHSSTLKHPRLAAFVIGSHQILPAGYGSQTVSYRVKKNQVLKVLSGSEHMSFQDQIDTAKKIADDHAKLTEYLGKTVIPQTVSVDECPYDPQRSAVLVTQPFVYLDYLAFGCNDHETKHNISQVIQRNPDAQSQLRNLTDGSHKLLEEQAMLPDLVGPNNIGFDIRSGALTLIDTIPLDDGLASYRTASLYRINIVEDTLDSLV